MKKGLFLDEDFSAEIVTYSKIAEYVDDSTRKKICDVLTIYHTEDSDTIVTINNKEYGLPAMIVPSNKMNGYDLEVLLNMFEEIEDNEIFIDEDYFYEESESDYSEDEEEDNTDDSDWY